MSNHNKLSTEIQEVFTPKKQNAMILSQTMVDLEHYNRAERLEHCANYLKFLTCENDGHSKLIGANFCRDRLCPQCNLRRSRKIFGQTMEILHIARERVKLRFLFLTLTIRNVKGENLKESIDNLYKGLKQFFEYKKIDGVTVGYVRNLEITYNEKEDTYHPHIHILLAVKPSYFKESDLYLTQAEWTSLWQRAMKLDYVPLVKVQAVKDKTGGNSVENGVLETAKYSLKDTDYIKDYNRALTEKIVEILIIALHRRRLIAYGKLFAKIRKELSLQDVETETVDLLDDSGTGCTCPICSGELKERLYLWRYGVGYELK